MSNASEKQTFPVSLGLGLVGILLACIAADINQEVISTALPDIRGALGISADTGRWIETLYDLGLAMGMLVAPSCAVMFSVRLFAAFAAAILGLIGVLCSLTSSVLVLLALSFVQGMANGSLIPLLLGSALRFLTPEIKLYGLAAYGLTATFAPNFSTPFVAWAHQSLGTRFVFIDILPLTAVGVGLILYGIPQDPRRLDQIRKLDWIGLVLGWFICFCVVVTATQGEHLDWSASPFIVTLWVALAIVLPLFVVYEWFNPNPVIWPQLLLRPNFAFAVVMLFGFVILNLANGLLPVEFLGRIHGYRALQAIPVMLIVALPSLILLPFVSFLLNFKWVDARWCILLGLILIGVGCWMNTHVDIEWIRHNFYVSQAVAALGQGLVVVSLLKVATSVVAPHEGIYAGATINTVRAFAIPIGQGALEYVLRVRSDKHSHDLLDRVGQHRFDLAQVRGLGQHGIPQGLGAGGGSPAELSEFASRINEHAHVLAFADAWWLMVILTAVLCVTCLAPQRVYPPRLGIPPGS